MEVATAAPGQSPTVVEGDPYRNSGDIMRMKSVHLDRKLSATARLPKRSTIVESPAGKSAHPSDALRSQRSEELGISPQPLQRPGVVHPGQAVPGRSPPQQHTTLNTQPQTNNSPGMLDIAQSGQVIRPSFARNNTEVMIVDDSSPNSPAIGPEEPPAVPVPDEGITLADIPQLMEAAQAREQQRSLPRQTSIPYIAELSALELAIVKHCAVLALYRSPLKDQFDLDEILELVEVKKGGFWNKLFKGGNDKKNVKKKGELNFSCPSQVKWLTSCVIGIFGVPLELLVEREGADSLLGATRSTLRVPSFIDDVVSAMRQMGEQCAVSFCYASTHSAIDMSIEGIFRKNGNIRKLKDLKDNLDRDASAVDLSIDNPVQLAALLKMFLRELPDPLLTFKLHRLCIASQSKFTSPLELSIGLKVCLDLVEEEDRRRLLHMVSILLPKAHRDTMEVLFVFLKWVASFSHLDAETGSKMDLGNLATVICPSILYSRGRDAVRDESFGAIRVVTSLLENQDEFYTVPEEFLGIIHDQEYFSNSMELPGKEFMKKCDTYMRLKANGRPTAMSPPVNSPYNSNNRFPPSESRERPSDPHLRNGRQQSPHSHHHHGMPHSPMTPGPPPSFSQGGAMMQGQQPRENDWHPPQRPSNNGSPNSQSRPNSYAPPPGSDPSQPSFGSPSVHPAPIVRQRT